MGCKCHTEWLDGGWGKRLRAKESQGLVHRLLPCSDECFIGIAILLVGYLLSPSCRLMFEPASPAGLGPGDNPGHCVSVVSLLQLNNNADVNGDLAVLLLCCCYVELLTLHAKYARISPPNFSFPFFSVRNNMVTWSSALKNKVRRLSCTCAASLGLHGLRSDSEQEADGSLLRWNFPVASFVSVEVFRGALGHDGRLMSCHSRGVLS